MPPRVHTKFRHHKPGSQRSDGLQPAPSPRDAQMPSLQQPVAQSSCSSHGEPTRRGSSHVPEMQTRPVSHGTPPSHESRKIQRPSMHGAWRPLRADKGPRCKMRCLCRLARRSAGRAGLGRRRSLLLHLQPCTRSRPDSPTRACTLQPAPVASPARRLASGRSHTGRPLRTGTRGPLRSCRTVRFLQKGRRRHRDTPDPARARVECR